MIDRKVVREFLDEELRETGILDDIFIGTENLPCTYYSKEVRCRLIPGIW